MSQSKRKKGYIKTFAVGDRVRIVRGTFKENTGIVTFIYGPSNSYPRGSTLVDLDPPFHGHARDQVFGFGSLVRDKETP